MKRLLRALGLSRTCVLAGCALTMATATTTASAAICAGGPLSLQAGLLSNASDWQEFDTRGKRLVHESGTMQGTEVTASWRCSDWELAAALGQLEGPRTYDGQTNSGTPVASQSALRQSFGHVQAGYRLSEAWQLGARVYGQTTWRDIASTSGASGYPERFDWTILSLGAQWDAPLAAGKVTVAAWVGTQLTSGMTLQLPGRDPSSLALGPIQQYELQIAWKLPLSQGWSVQADLRYTATDIGQGPETVISRGGIPVGVARQPHTNSVEVPLGLRLGYTF